MRHSHASALSQLCEIYWYPLYAYVRGQGQQHANAQDLTQAFFERLLEKGLVSVADRDRGKFRTFLLSALKNFIANEYAKLSAEKRGGGRRSLSLDFSAADERWKLEPRSDASPELEYDRRWATSLLDRVLALLQNQYHDNDKRELFEVLSPYLVGTNAGGKSVSNPYAAAAEQLSISVANVKVSVHRMRSRYRELLRREIGNTLSDPTDIEDEIAELFKLLASEQ